MDVCVVDLFITMGGILSSKIPTDIESTDIVCAFF